MTYNFLFKKISASQGVMTTHMRLTLFIDDFLVTRAELTAQPICKVKETRHSVLCTIEHYFKMENDITILQDTLPIGSVILMRSQK